MTDRWVVVLAAAAAAGALRPGPVPIVVGAVGALVALRCRRPALLCAAVAVLVSSLAGRALAGLDAPTEADVRAEITLVTDPEPAFGGVRAEAQLGPRRVQVQADGIAAQALRDRLAGERVQVRGALGPLPRTAPWLVARHLAGRLRVHLVEGWDPGRAPARAANAIRRLLDDGAAPLRDVHRALYLGLVIGDDRAQPPALADDFQGAGLTHLLAVSGQNVAFVLVLAGPVLRSLRLWPRAALAVALIALFGLMTRFEPSVLRASAMAAAAVLTTTLGTPLPRLRILALAVTGLLIVDPLLVRSVGFQLSVAAASAIVAAAPAIADALPGPRWVADPLGVTIAAQLGVAPVVLATFGPLPVASLPANLLAVPVAGVVMAWGLTAGLAAGLAGGTTAAVLHLPTQVLLRWLEVVAWRGAALPLGQLGWPHVALLAAGLALVMTERRLTADGAADRMGGWLRRAGTAATIIAVGAAVLGANADPGLRSELRPGVVRWHAAGTEVVVLGGAGGRTQLGAADVLAALRTAGVGAIDLLVVADASIGAPVVTAIADRHPVGLVVAHQQPDAEALAMAADTVVVAAPTSREVVRIGSLEVQCTPTGDRLVVEARRAAA